MTKPEAVRILIRNAAANCAGVGQGIRALPAESEKALVKQAIQVLWKLSGSKYELTDSVYMNLGL